jgi:hypothetical protein
MMAPSNNCAPAGQAAWARGDTKTLDASVPHDAPAGKWLAMAQFNAGARSLSETEAAFSRHPEWRAA